MVTTTAFLLGQSGNCSRFLERRSCKVSLGLGGRRLRSRTLLLSLRLSGLLRNCSLLGAPLLFFGYRTTPLGFHLTAARFVRTFHGTSRGCFRCLALPVSFQL